jgi:hypothetical protein
MNLRTLPLGLVHNHQERSYCYRRGTKRKPVYFSYRRGKDHEGVLAEALHYAHEKNQELGPTPKPAKGLLTLRNTSGVVGVNLDQQIIKENTYYSWAARWPGNRAGVRFSINSWGGDEKSFLLACISRELESKDRELIQHTYRQYQQENKLEHYLRCKNLSGKITTKVTPPASAPVTPEIVSPQVPINPLDPVNPVVPLTTVTSTTPFLLETSEDDLSPLAAPNSTVSQVASAPPDPEPSPKADPGPKTGWLRPLHYFGTLISASPFSSSK